MARDLSSLSDEQLEKKLKGANISLKRAEKGSEIEKAAIKKIEALEKEVEIRAKAAAKDVKEEVKKEEKKVEKAVEKVVDKVEDKPAEKKEEKPAAKKEEKKPAAAKKEEKKEEKPKAEKPAAKTEKKPAAKKPAEKFELVIDGKTYTFSDKKSKDECAKALKAVKARAEEVETHQAARQEGMDKAREIPVTKRIADSFASIAKKAVSTVPKTKITKKPAEIKKELDAVEKAFAALFDSLEALMDKKIPKTQRAQIMAILTKFEEKVAKETTPAATDSKDDKKEKAANKTRKEDGGLAGNPFGAGNPYSFASLL